MVTLQMHMRVFSLLFTIGVCGFLLSACAHESVAPTDQAVSVKVCKRAIIRHNAPVTITGYAPQTPAKTLHACYKGDTAFLPAPKLKRDQR